ncbi:MAG: hypothetical protein ACK5GG_00630 [Betaproteobacteria bacterium]
MNINQQAALTLSKSNLSLLVTLCELGRTQSAKMINELEIQLESCYKEFESTSQALLQASDWAAVCSALSNMPLLVMRLQLHQSQKILESSIAAQLRISTVSREAMANWQRETALALQEGAGAMPLSTTLRGFFGKGPADSASMNSGARPLGQLLHIQT